MTRSQIRDRFSLSRVEIAQDGIFAIIDSWYTDQIEEFKEGFHFRLVVIKNNKVVYSIEECRFEFEKDIQLSIPSLRCSFIVSDSVPNKGLYEFSKLFENTPFSIKTRLPQSIIVEQVADCSNLIDIINSIATNSSELAEHEPDIQIVKLEQSDMCHMYIGNNTPVFIDKEASTFLAFGGEDAVVKKISAMLPDDGNLYIALMKTHGVWRVLSTGVGRSAYAVVFNARESRTGDRSIVYRSYADQVMLGGESGPRVVYQHQYFTATF